MKINEIIKEIEDFAPTHLQEDYDNTGYSYGDPEAEVTGVLITIDITPEVVREAIRKKCNLILSHHPLIFHGLKKILPGSWLSDSLILAVRNGITLYAAHTNLDAVRGGVSWKMAEKLGLMECDFLMPGDNGSGLGLIGELEEKVPVLAFLQKVKSLFGCEALRHSPLCRKEVSRIALCGGSGAEFIDTAIQKHADIYISADIKYHDWFNADNRLVIADIGHFESEQFTKEIFYGILRKKITNFEVLFSETATNPVSVI